MTRADAFRLAFTNARADLCLVRDKGSVRPIPPVTRRRIPRWRMSTTTNGGK